MTSRKVDGNSSVVDNLLSAASGLDPSGKSGFILGSIKSIKSILSIRDRVYISKFGKFWRAFEENKIEVDEFISKTEEQEDWQKVGENFLLVMDSFSAFDKCYYYGKVWISWLKKEINTNEFIEITNILQNIFITDLNYILYHHNDMRFNFDLNKDRLYSCGFLQRILINSSFPPNLGRRFMESGVQKDFDILKDYVDGVIRHLNQPYTITNSGNKLIEILTKK